MQKRLNLLFIGIDFDFKSKLIAAGRKSNLNLKLLEYSLDDFKNHLKESQADAIFCYGQGSFLHQRKIIHELTKLVPNVPVVMVTPKTDVSHAIQLFRAGAVDLILPPFDPWELSQSLRRLSQKMIDWKRSREWNPIEAASYYFTRPIADHWDDFAENINQYFSLFIEVFEHRRFILPHGIADYLGQKHDLAESEIEHLHKFLENPKALFLGLSRSRSQLAWLVKLAPDYVCYWSGRDLRKSEISKIFGASCMRLIASQKQSYLIHLDKEKLRRLALTDEITGLWNQRKLSEDISQRVSEKSPFALLFIDIDFFKTVNDRFGHIHGSQLLIDMAEILRRELRGTDSIYRYGGDEFIILLPGTKIDAAKLIAVRLSNAIKEHEFSVQSKPYKLSLSVGIADYPHDASTAKDLIDFADKMMYMSKKNGRGKVFHLSEVS
jgi:diguanylate cyclase (GGDEF)-like protein